jgi:hypothetical protein
MIALKPDRRAYPITWSQGLHLWLAGNTLTAVVQGTTSVLAFLLMVHGVAVSRPGMWAAAATVLLLQSELLDAWVMVVRERARLLRPHELAAVRERWPA